MISKARGKPDGPQPRKRGRKAEPLDIELTVRFNFGDRPHERVTVIDQRRVPMIGGLIANRDRILRGFVRLLLRAASQQPAVARELLVPLRRTMRRPRSTD